MLLGGADGQKRGTGWECFAERLAMLTRYYLQVLFKR